MLTLFPMLIFVSLPKPGRFPPILGRLILLPEPGKLMFPSGRLIPGQFPPITGRSTLPGNVVGRLMLFVLPSEGRSPLPGRVGRFCPIPVDGRVNGSCELGGLICGRLFELGSEGRVPIEGFEGSVVGREMLGRLPAPPSDGRDPPREAGPLELPPKLAIEGWPFTFPNEGLDGFAALGLDMFGILGRAPPPPMFAIEGLAPPPPRPRCAIASGSHAAPNTNATKIADILPVLLIVNVLCFMKCEWIICRR